jgi:hypothetical protein
MKIKVDEVNLRVTQKYPYTHRVELSADAMAADKVAPWLIENGIPHTKIGWGVYYMKKEHVSWLLLRWS